MGKQQDLSMCKWVVYRFKIPQTSAELEQRLNNTLAAASQLGKIVLSKMFPACDEEIVVMYLVCPQ
jgi:nitric oxide reductase activation protein